MKIKCGDTYGVTLVWREEGSNERYDDDCIGRESKDGETVMVWGCIAWGFKGPLYIWTPETKEEKETAEKEIDRLNKEMRERSEELEKIWKASPEWKNLRDRELEENRRVLQMYKDLGTQGRPLPKPWMPHTHRGKKFAVDKVQRSKRSKGGIDSWRYVRLVCEPIFWPWLRKHNLILQDDNAPSHASKFTASARILAEIERLEWPANSPDLNPIEHIWDLIKKRVLRRRGADKPTTRNAMVDALKEEWDKVTIEEINEAIERLPKRVKQCLKAKGDNNYQA